MPILPIDLQTMFAQMNQVGKEQAQQEHAAPAAQSQHASALVRESQSRDASVNEANDVGEGVESVGDEDEKEGREGGARKRKGQAREERREVFTDPDLGQNIDITG